MKHKKWVVVLIVLCFFLVTYLGWKNRLEIFDWWRGYRVTWIEEENLSLQKVNNVGEVLAVRKYLDSSNNLIWKWGIWRPSEMKYTVAQNIIKNEIDGNEILLLPQGGYVSRELPVETISTLLSENTLAASQIALNSNREIIGHYWTTPSNWTYRQMGKAFKYTFDGKFIDIHKDLKAQFSNTRIINSKGWVCGYKVLQGNSQIPYLWKNGKEIEFKVNNVPGNPYVAAMNNRGEIIVNFLGQGGDSLASCLWTGKNQYEMLKTKKGYRWIHSVAIDNSGKVLVGMRNEGTITSYFIYRKGEYTSLPTLDRSFESQEHGKKETQYFSLSPDGRWLIGAVNVRKGESAKRYSYPFLLRLYR